MELKGFVGPYEGSKPREVKLSISDYLRLFDGQAQGTSPGSETVTGQTGKNDKPPTGNSAHVQNSTSGKP